MKYDRVMQDKVSCIVPYYLGNEDHKYKFKYKWYMAFWVKLEYKNHECLGPKWTISYHVLKCGIKDCIRA